MTAPPDAFSKEYMQTTSLELKGELNQIIRSDYSSHKNRLQAISQMCKGKSELDRIQLTSYLGSQLSVIYDYDRTDPKKAAPGTIRADFADSIDANAVHGSDAAETAAVEIAFFFPGMQVFSR